MAQETAVEKLKVCIIYIDAPRKIFN